MSKPCHGSRSGGKLCSICEDGSPFAELLTFRCLYHQLQGVQQLQLLSTSYSAGALTADQVARVKWRLLGKRTCTSRLFSVLGTCSRTFYKKVHGHIDKRVFNGRRKTVASISVDQFFLELYHSAAEFLPEDSSCHVAGVDASIEEDSAGPRVQTPTEPPPLPEWDAGKEFLQNAMSLGSNADLPKKYAPWACKLVMLSVSLVFQFLISLPMRMTLNLPAAKPD